MMKKTLFLLLFSTVLGYNTLQAQQTKSALDTTKQVPQEWRFSKYRFGGYGEVLFQSMNYGADRYTNANGAPRQNRSYISIPRAVFAFDYKFRDDIILGSELEIEYGGAGAAMELEYEEGGEYEMEIEKGGEIELEQFHITKRFSNAFNVRVGHMIVPVGITNAHHEPILFFTTARPEGEMTILPCTWHETGVSILGYAGGFKYELMMVNGLDPNGFSSLNWIQGGKQGMFETSVMSSPAFAGRLDYSGIKHLRLGVSAYYNSTAKNASKPEKMSGIKAPVTIGTFDAQYLTRDFAVRLNGIYGNLGASRRLSEINRTISKATNYPRTPVAKNAVSYSIEAGYNIMSLFNTKERLMPFVRYEYYNSAEKVETGMSEMPINKRDVYTFGFNYYLLPNMVMKADYSVRKLNKGAYNDENTFGLALVYTGWFSQK